jgi:hypothetical protein
MDDEVDFEQASELPTEDMGYAEFPDAFTMLEGQGSDEDSDFYGFSNQDLNILQSTILSHEAHHSLIP